MGKKLDKKLKHRGRATHAATSQLATLISSQMLLLMIALVLVAAAINTLTLLEYFSETQTETDARPTHSVIHKPTASVRKLHSEDISRLPFRPQFKREPVIIQGMCFLYSGTEAFKAGVVATSTKHGKRGCETTFSSLQMTNSLSGHQLTEGRTYESDSPVFTYWDTQKPLAIISDLQQNTPTGEIQNITFTELVTRIQKAPPYVYHSSRAEGSAMKAIANHVDIQSFRGWNMLPGAADSGQNVWIGGAGVTASAHYDTSDNMYLQLDGQKTFYLSKIESAHEHSLLHPHFRRAQVEPKVDLVARLEPGDVLYLPPYMYHRVVSDTEGLSMSVNTWTTNPLTNDIAKLTNYALQGWIIPAEGWSTLQKTAMLDRIFKRVLEVAGYPHPSKWIHEMTLRRWRVVFRTMEPSTDKTVLSFCSSNVKGRAAMLSALNIASTEETIVAVSDQVSQGLNALEGMDGHGAKDIEAGNILEALAYGTFQDVNLVANLFLHCFNVSTEATLADALQRPR